MPLFDVEPPAGCHPEIGLLAAAWRDSTREWRKQLSSAPEEAIVWQPRPGGHSIGGLLLHMAACEHYWIADRTFGKTIDPDHPAVRYDAQVDQYSGKWLPPPKRPLSWYYAVQDETRQHVLGLLEAERDPARILHLDGRPDFTVRWAIAHLIEHDSYHGGQMVLLKDLWGHEAGSPPAAE